VVRQPRSDDEFDDKLPSQPEGIFYVLRLVYTRLSRVLPRRLRDRVYFTEDEVRYMIDIVDIWIEGHSPAGFDAEDDEVATLFENMSTAVDVRNKLWKQLTQEG